MRVLVTGGGGFLGQAVCAQLVNRGYTVRALNRNRYPALADLSVEQHVGDIREVGVVESATQGCWGVVHCAAKAGIWGPPREYAEINIGGTDNVLAACARQGVARLVHTSTPSVVHDGTDLAGVDESAPYARHFLAPYPRTKAEAERRVLAANSAHLATVALRPHLIWGPRDPHFVPRLLRAARQGRLRFIGAEGKLVDTVYVDNAAESHVLALERLTPGSAIAGRAYFITQGQPLPIEVLVNGLLRAGGLPQETRRLPLGLARFLGHVLESGFRIARVRAEPPLTRFLVEQLSTAHWFDISAARNDLGYVPRVSTDEGVLRLAEYLAGNPR